MGVHPNVLSSRCCWCACLALHVPFAASMVRGQHQALGLSVRQYLAAGCFVGFLREGVQGGYLGNLREPWGS